MTSREIGYSFHFWHFKHCNTCNCITTTHQDCVFIALSRNVHQTDCSSGFFNEFIENFTFLIDQIIVFLFTVFFRVVTTHTIYEFEFFILIEFFLSNHIFIKAVIQSTHAKFILVLSNKRKTNGLYQIERGVVEFNNECIVCFNNITSYCVVCHKWLFIIRGNVVFGTSDVEHFKNRSIAIAEEVEWFLKMIERCRHFVLSITNSFWIVDGNIIFVL